MDMDPVTRLTHQKKRLSRLASRLIFMYYQAIRQNDLKEVKVLLERLKDGNLNRMNLKNHVLTDNSPLTVGIQSESTEVSLYLVPRLNLALGSTPPLVAAVAGENWKVFKKLLKYQAPLNLSNANGDTALHIAARMGLKNYVVELVEHGALLNVLNHRSLTPLDEAIIFLHSDLMDWLEWPAVA